LISVLHRCGNSLPIFVYCETTGEKNEHIMRPILVGKSSVTGGGLLEINYFTPPPLTGAKIKVCVIV